MSTVTRFSLSDECLWAIVYEDPTAPPKERFGSVVFRYPASWDDEQVLEDIEVWLDVNHPAARLREHTHIRDPK